MGISLLATAAFIVSQTGCKPVETDDYFNVDPDTLPDNPFDTLTYPISQIDDIEVDSATFVGLHSHIFAKACNRPGCHDGSFEPDFRTVQSAYNSLVYHGITKNYDTNPLPYRVTPGNKDQSMLWHRVSYHNPPNFERMPSSGNALSQLALDNIAAWIDGGAKDIFGNNPTFKSLQPQSWGVVAYSPSGSSTRIDDDRGGVLYQPFTAPANSAIDLWFGYLDETPAGDTVFGDQMSYNKIQFSTSAFDFSSAVEMPLTKEFTLLTAKYVPAAFSQNVGFPLPYTHHITITPSALGFSAGQTVYMRTFVKDSDHSFATEIPKSDSQAWLIGYFSMILQ